MQNSPLPDNAWAHFTGQHGIAVSSEHFGGGPLATDLFWKRGFCFVDASCAVQAAFKDREQDAAHLSNVSLASEIRVT